MKKLLALCLSLALCLGSVVTVTAAEYGPYTLKEDGEYGGTAHFDAAYLTTETVMFRDPEYGGVDPLDVLAPRPPAAGPEGRTGHHAWKILRICPQGGA